jgi:hypothetical protein
VARVCEKKALSRALLLCRPPRHASPHHDARARRGLRNVPRCRAFLFIKHDWTMELNGHVEAKKICLSRKWIRDCSVRLLAVRFTSRDACSPPSVAIKERSLLSANTQHTATTASCLQSFALPHNLPHPVLRRAPRARTVGLRNPVSCDPVWERGDKVFGERSAHLLASSSSRTPTRTTSSPTRTSSPTSTTSSVTCLSLTATATAVLHPHRLQHRMSSWSSLVCFSFSD